MAEGIKLTPDIDLALLLNRRIAIDQSPTPTTELARTAQFQGYQKGQKRGKKDFILYPMKRKR